MGLRLLRAAYGIEFFVALVATLDFWGQVGGQGHLDLMAWWWKMVLSLAMAAAVVKLTAVSARPAGWKSKATFGWVLAILGLLIVGAGVTYYYHVHEPLDQGDQDPELTTRLVNMSGWPISSARVRVIVSRRRIARQFQSIGQAVLSCSSS